MERGTLVKIKGPDTLNLKSLGRSFYVAEYIYHLNFNFPPSNHFSLIFFFFFGATFFFRCTTNPTLILCFAAHAKSGGHTSLSASGVLLVPSKGVVITSGTLIAPFLETLSAPPAPPKLSRGTTLEVLLDSHYTHSRNATDEVASGVKWIPAKLLELVFCEDVKYALDRLVDGREWVVGWPRQTDQIGSQDLARVDQLANQYWKGIEAFAILQLAEIPSSLYDEPPLPLSQQSLIVRYTMSTLIIGGVMTIVVSSVDCHYHSWAPRLAFCHLFCSAIASTEPWLAILCQLLGGIATAMVDHYRRWGVPVKAHLQVLAIC
jgi:hypothetical protein